MIINKRILLSMCVLVYASARGTDYYVAAGGADSNPGTEAEPFLTFDKSVSVLAGGDTLFLRDGLYNETLVFSGVSASLTNAITIQSYPGEQAVFDGMVDISDIAAGPWELYTGSVYRIEITNDIWQLIVDDQEMIRARWPNASLDPTSENYLWAGRDTAAYATVESGTGYGTIVDSALTNFPYSLNGTMAVMNHRFRAYQRLVEGHVAGGNSFTHQRDIDQRHKDPADRDENNYPSGKAQHYQEPSILAMRYHLECRLEFLDAPGEWFYDKETGMLYAWTPDGSNPALKSVRGKVKDYGVTVFDSGGLVFDGVDFSGCTFWMDDVEECEVVNCNLKHIGALRNMLGEEVPHLIRNNKELFLPTQIESKGGAGAVVTNGMDTWEGTTDDHQLAVRNCRFEYGDGSALFIKGNQYEVENCRFTYIDWITMGGSPFVGASGWRKRLSRLEFEWCPNSKTMSPGKSSLVELCDFGQQLGEGQEDGANIEMTSHFNCVVRKCWFHDNTKFGPRFDGDTVRDDRENGWIYGNVAWNMETSETDPEWQKGAQIIKLKGDKHHAFNNTLFGILNIDIGVPEVMPEPGMGKYDPASTNYMNMNSVIRNNLCEFISGSRAVQHAEAGEHPPAGMEDHNLHEDAAAYLRAPEFRDFRPKAGSPVIDAGTNFLSSTLLEAQADPFVKTTEGYMGAAPDIGAYEYGCTNYWIPGFQSAKASKPIPPDGSAGHATDRDLVWLGGYQGTSFDVYFGTDSNAVTSATRASPEFRGNQLNNIYMPTNPVSNATCFWRIDTLTPEGTVTGDVWRLIYSQLLVEPVQGFIWDR